VQIEYEDELSREALATHEAGHALAFLIAGCPFHSLTIEAEAVDYGIRDGAIVPDPDRAQKFVLRNPPMAFVMYLVTTCVGDVAVAQYEGKETANIKVRDAEHESKDDASQLYTVSQALRLPVEAAGQIAVGIAYELFKRRSIWKAVERIRDLLLDRVTVTYSDAAKAFYATVSKKDLQWARDSLAQCGRELYGYAHRQQHVNAGVLVNTISAIFPRSPIKP